MFDEVKSLLEERQAIFERLKDNSDFQAFLTLEDKLHRQTHAFGGLRVRIPAPASRVAPRKARKSKTQQVKEQVAEILRKAHKPMSTRTILEELENRGVKVGGKNPITNLSAKLSADAGFKNTRREGWEMKRPSTPIPLPLFLQNRAV